MCVYTEKLFAKMKRLFLLFVLALATLLPAVPHCQSCSAALSQRHPASSDLPWPRRWATTVVRGRVLGKPADKEEVLSVSFSSATRNIKGDMMPAAFKDSAGVFSVKWDMCWPMTTGIRLCDIGIQLTLCPGDTIDITMDYAKAMEVKGDTRRLLTEAVQIEGGRFRRSPEYCCVAGKLLLDAAEIDTKYIQAHAAEGFPAYREWVWGKHLARLDSLRAAGLPSDEEECLQMELESAYLSALRNRPYLMKVSRCDSADVARAGGEFVREDPHFAQLLFPRSMVAACFYDTGILEDLKANGLADLPLGQFLREREAAEEMAARIKAGGQVTRADIERLAEEFRAPLAELIEEMQTTAADTAEWRPDGEPDTWLRQIVERHAGHVVFVDFWATWCGPCQKGIAEMEAVKAGYEQRGVDFVYITDNSSSSDGFLSMKREHTGDHFLFTKQEIKQMNVPEYDGSIPHYLIYGRDGRLVKVLTGWGELERVTQELDGALQNPSE